MKLLVSVMAMFLSRGIDGRNRCVVECDSSCMKKQGEKDGEVRHASRRAAIDGVFEGGGSMNAIHDWLMLGSV